MVENFRWLFTIRNWTIGCYIVEFEQNGQDRAKYGSHLLSNLADRLQIKGLDRSMLNQCRTFYQRYPQICDSVNHKLKSIGEIKGLPDKNMLTDFIMKQREELGYDPD